MKQSIAILMVLFSLISCGKKDDDSSDPAVIDSRLYADDGVWTVNYTQNGAPYKETLTFTPDEVQFRKENIQNSPYVLVFDKRLALDPITNSRATGTNVADTSEVWDWNYFINGTTLRLCDAQEYCAEFQKN